jgi:hypothetical protein
MFSMAGLNVGFWLVIENKAGNIYPTENNK